MKKILILSFLFFFSFGVYAQLEKVIVETYYISDSLDATDTVDGRVLQKGSKTYRIYIDMAKGCKLTKLYGANNHPLSIKSTAAFYNNIDRSTEYFGYLIKKNYFSGNPTLALDSWLTLGLATTAHVAAPKPEDTDGSYFGSYSLLQNNDPLAGIPIRTKDGLLPAQTYTSQFIDFGFRDAAGNDTTVFGATLTGNQFLSDTSYIQQSAGVSGANPDSNRVLVAQLTTPGDISFELNVELMDSTGHVFKYVAKNNTGTELLNPYLTYPQACGCRDTRYLEYSPTYACDDPSACKTLKVYGCTDTMACNYNPSANILLPNFCCYPGYCYDRDLTYACNSLSNQRLAAVRTEIYPSPAHDILSLQLYSSTNLRGVTYTVYNSYDGIVLQKNMGMIQGDSRMDVDVTTLKPGLYLVRVSVDGYTSIKKFFKD